MPAPETLEQLRAANGTEWKRIRDRVSILPDGSEEVRGIKDISYVACRSPQLIRKAIKNNTQPPEDPTIPALPYHVHTHASGPERITYAVWLRDLIAWRAKFIVNHVDIQARLI